MGIQLCIRCYHGNHAIYEVGVGGTGDQLECGFFRTRLRLLGQRDLGLI